MDTNTNATQPTESGATRLANRLKNWGAQLVAAIEDEPDRPIESLTDTQLIMKALANSHQLSMGDDVRRELRRRANDSPETEVHAKDAGDAKTQEFNRG